MKKLLTCIIGIGLTGSLAFSATVSPPAAPSVSAGGNSFNPVFSADGQKLVFVSHANNLVTNDDLGLWLDVFVRDLVTSNTLLVSVSANGTGGANWDANYPSISSNGQFIAFVSRASNLVPGVTNDLFLNIFVRDVNAGLTRLVSVDTNGNQSTGGANPRISADGRYVFFESLANNLTAESVAQFESHLYRRDLWSNITVRANEPVNFSPAAVQHDLGGITPDGQFTAYIRRTNSIIPSTDAFVHQVGANTTWVSVNVAGLLPGGYRCSPPVISDDGRYAAFYATPLTGGNTLALHHDTQTSTTLVISSLATNLNHGLQISANGQRVLFEFMDGIYARPAIWETTGGGVVTPIVCNGLDLRGNPAMTPTASAVTYIGCSNIYFTGAGSTNALISAATNDAPSGGDYQFVTPAISPDGARVAFAVKANDLVPGDLNGQSDIYLRDVNTGVTELITKAASSKPATTAFAHSFLGPNSVSANGRFIVSTRYDDPSAYRDTNGLLDIFVSDRVLGTAQAVSIDTNLYFIPPGVGPGYFTNVENTNVYFTPMISADGSVIAADTWFSANMQVAWWRATNGFFSSGRRLVNRMSSSATSGLPAGNSYLNSLSSNGLDVVFTTTANNIVFDNGVVDNNGVSDVVLRRLDSFTLEGTNYLVSTTPGNVAGNGTSTNGLISPDGRWVIFESMASDLVTNATGGLLGLYARDVWSNKTHLVSISPSGGAQWGYVPKSATVSGNSRYVAFSSGNIYLTVYDLITHTSVVAENPVARSAALDYSGRFVAFVKKPSGFNFDQVFMRDMQGSQSELMSARPDGGEPNAASSNPLVAGNGRYVLFQSKASNLVGQDSNGANDIFIRDRLLGMTLVLSANGQGMGNATSTKPVLAANGRTVVFQSFASDLVAGDFNDMRDLFVLTLGGVDSEPDGMDDDWEVAFFGDLSHTGPADTDSDGATDLQEFLAGTDPTNGNSVFRVLTVAPAGGGAKTLLWSGNPTRSYRAEFKDDLTATSWIALNGTISWNGTTASISDPSASGATNRFYRVLRLP
jgi:Tol biopolymer transport system component